MSEYKSGPWLAGIVDTLVGANLIRQSTISHRNRLAVVLIDSAFETACRAYLRYKAKIKLTDAHRYRDNLIKTVKDKLKGVEAGVWDSIDYYYNEIRCDLYHDSAGKTITDVSLLEYKETVEFIIDTAFDIQTAMIVNSGLSKVQSGTPSVKDNSNIDNDIQWDKLSGKVDKLLVAISEIHPKNTTDVNEFFKREGVPLRLLQTDFTNIVARNKGSKNFFYYNKELRQWELSGTGRFKVRQILQEEKND